MDVRTYIVRIHHLLNTAFEQLLVYMLVDTGEDDGHALAVGTLDKHGEVVHRRGIDKRHLRRLPNGRQKRPDAGREIKCWTEPDSEYVGKMLTAINQLGFFEA